jgi:hypothetical protein
MSLIYGPKVRLTFANDILLQYIDALKGQSHEKVCEIMTEDGKMGLN